jgi:hypothetical protein
MEDGKPLRGVRKVGIVSLQTLEEVKNLLLSKQVPPAPPGGKSHSSAGNRPTAPP